MEHDPNIDRLYREGVAAIRAGDHAAGREKLMQVVTLDRFHEQAWLWLSAAVETDSERIICLKNVLTINPGNEAARRGLEKLGEAAPEMPPRPIPDPPLVRHAAPEAVGADLHARVSGLPRSSFRDEPPADESWRAPLLDPAYMTSTATLAPPIEAKPRRSLLDLFDVWADMLILNVYGGFVDEIKYGGFGHVVVNILAAGLLQAISSTLLILALFVLPGANFQPPLLRSIAGLLGEMAAGDPLLQAELEAAGLGTLGELGALTPMAGMPADAALGLMAILGGALIAYAVLSVPLVFIGQMFQAVVTNAVSVWLLGGRGDAVRTMHALSIALVVAQIVQLPVMLVLPFVSVGAALIILLAIQLYQFVLASTTLGAVHGFGVLVSMGAIVLSGIATQAICGAASYGLSFLIALLG
jgi:hypothetical protein